jgi:low temperature requirement protein LtrA
MRAMDEPVRVSTLELFFDLVFVFTITQLTTVLVREPTGKGVLQVVLMLGVIWWMYAGYAWLTNAVPPNSAQRRLLLLGGMAGFLVLALSIPHAFRGSGLSFGLAYLLVVSVHSWLFTRTSSENVLRAILRIVPFNAATGGLVLIGGALGGTLQYVLWAMAVTAEWVTPRLTEDTGFYIAPSHFVERHGLVVIVAIGESVVAVGIGATGLPVDLPLIGVAVLGLALSACLWWAYFGSDDDLAEESLSGAPVPRRPRLAVDAYGYWHIPILLGIVLMAAALRHATGHAFSELPTAQALELSGGAALFMAAEVAFRHTLGIGPSGWRLLAVAGALVTIPVGLSASAVAQLGALAALLAAALGAELALSPPRLAGAYAPRSGRSG